MVNPASIANLIPFKPGESGNPLGRRTAGAYVREQVNSLANKDLSESQLRTIANDKSLGWTMRAAAQRILATLERGDMADFEPVLKGKVSLKRLRRRGINTELVKRMAVNDKGITIELHDRSRDDFITVIEQTDGKPAGRLEVDITERVVLIDDLDKPEHEMIDVAVVPQLPEPHA